VRALAGQRLVRAEATSVLAAALAVGGCVSATPHAPGRAEVIRHVVPATVQLESQREGGARRAGSGVVIAVDGPRTLIITTRHFLDPDVPQTISARPSGMRQRRPATIVGVSRDDDLAVLAVDGLRVSPVPLKSAVALGDEVWVTGFPWGGRMTLVSGIVSQVLDKDGYGALEGPPRMVDASVSYGVSGGGVFDATSGALVGIVEGYRTSRVALPQPEERVLTLPVPGETLLISSEAILHFLESSGLDRLVRR
jgi:serine protease Do